MLHLCHAASALQVVKQLLCSLSDVNSSSFLSCYLAQRPNNVNTSRCDALHAAFPAFFNITAAQQHSGLPIGGGTGTQSMPTYTFLGQQMLILCLQATVTASAAAAAVAKAHGMLLLLLLLKLMACCCFCCRCWTRPATVVDFHSMAETLCSQVKDRQAT